MMYYVNIQKVGCKSMKKAHRRVYDHYEHEGMVVMGYYDNDKPIGVKREHPILVPIEQRLHEIVREYINSGAYSRITVTIPNDCGHDKKVFEWRMSESVKVKRTKSHAEYTAKRNELKAEIARLQAELKALDEEWYS